jgi:DNA-binding transcriptional ArsR family regulator
MVIYMTHDPLTLTFAALADPTRRAILQRLAGGHAVVKDIARPFGMSSPAISKHLRVLERAGLVEQGRQAQWRPRRLLGQPLKDAADWLQAYPPVLGSAVRPHGRGIATNEGRRAARAPTRRPAPPGCAPQVNTRNPPMSNVAAPAATEKALVLRRVFEAPRETVFRLWSDPSPGQGMVASEGLHDHPLRDGVPRGRHLPLHRSLGSPRVLGVRGLPCHRRAAPDRDELQWDSGNAALDRPTQVTLTFEEQGADKTLLTFCQEPFDSEAERISHSQGWGQVLDAFAAKLAGEKA